MVEATFVQIGVYTLFISALSLWLGRILKEKADQLALMLVGLCCLGVVSMLSSVFWQVALSLLGWTCIFSSLRLWGYFRKR